MIDNSPKLEVARELARMGKNVKRRAPIDYWRMFVTDDILDDSVRAARVRIEFENRGTRCRTDP